MQYTLEPAPEVSEGAPAVPLADRIIEKTGQVIKFTANEVIDSLKQIAKNIRTLQPKKEYEQAIITNIEDHHPEVKEMSEETLLSAYMYYEARTRLKATNKALDESIQDQTDTLADIEDFKAQIPELAEIDFTFPEPAVAPKTSGTAQEVKAADSETNEK